MHADKRANSPSAFVRVRPRFKLLLFLFSSFCLPPSSVSPCFAGTLRTLDGRSFDGDVKFDASGQIVVRLVDGKSEKVDLADVLYADFRPAAPRPTKPPARTTPAAPGRLAPPVLLPPRAQDDALPAPWQAVDVGNVTKTYAKYKVDGQAFSIKSASGRLGGDVDAFCFVAQQIAGDAELVVKLVDVKDAQQVAQGLMFRTGPEADAAYAGVVVKGGSYRLVRRTRQGGHSENAEAGERAMFPVWLRLTRRGGVVTAFASADGERWDELGTETIKADGPMLAGVAVCGTSSSQMGGHLTALRLTRAEPAAAPPAPPADAGVAASTAAAVIAPASIKEGVVLRSGTVLAGVQLSRSDGATPRFEPRGRGADDGAGVAAAHVARVIFRELSPEQAARIPEKRTGVLLREGDFIEGEFKGMRGGRIQLSSVLFGLSSFDTRDKAAALVLADVDPARPDAVVRAQDGSTYAGKSLSIANGRLVVDDPVAGPFAVPFAQVVELSAGAARLEPLGALRPQKLDPPAGENGGGGFWVDGTGVGLPMKLGPVTCRHGVTLAAGSAATWDLAGKYRTLTFKCGVPRGVLPTAGVRFVVTADGKELFRSKPLTSLDPPLAAAVKVAGVKALTLKVESTAGDAFTTPGTWGDAALLK